MAKHKDPDNTVCRNRRASHRFEILERIECGVELRGTEVKSLRDRNASIEEAFARIERGELWLIGCHIAAYKFGHTQNHEPLRRRKLLVHKRELAKLRTRVEQKGLTLIPLGLYFNSRGVAKVSLGVVRGKKFGDKRQDMKVRDAQREMERGLRGRS